jgi:hypothetical protein
LVEVIIDLIASGMSFDDILSDHPELEKDDILAALAYAKITLSQEANNKDFWTELPEHVKAGIERGRKQVVEDKLTPYDEVMKKYATYL